ncbi:helix-turn-helix transcriptional regulator [Noviherbaspirillum sp.]|uniref:helix-turn-helix transcriptional regulator n=1 Tax=Noviherbaspirillum sp. TaxID=1926288 RepID=UPI002FE04B99
MHRGNTLKAGLDRSLYIGELPASGWHRHASPVLLIGLSGRFAIHLPDGRIETCHSALIDTGVEHVFDPRGERVALMYLEPDSKEARSLRARVRRDGPVIFDPAMLPVSRSHYESRLDAFDLSALLRRAAPDDAPPLDARVERSLLSLRMLRDEPLARDDAASIAHLSASRFNHLFREEMGISFREYRIWTQIRSAIIGFRPDGSLTDAAMNGAFADAAHFSRLFRQTFGMTPSSVLKPLKDVTLLR